MAKNGLKSTNSNSVTFDSIIPSKVCKHCGREFVLPVGANFTDYVYKEYRPRGTAYYCSWRCLQAARLNKVVKVSVAEKNFAWNEKRIAAQRATQLAQMKAIMPYHKQGFSTRQISRETGMSYTTISRRLRDYEKGVLVCAEE